MGFSQVVATAILLTGGTYVAFDTVDGYFDNQSAINSAWQEATEFDHHVRQTSMTIVDVSTTGGVTTITINNTGDTTLDASQVDLYFEGAPVTIDSYLVNGVSSTVWPPLVEAKFDVTFTPAPSGVVAVSRHGVVEVWR